MSTLAFKIIHFFSPFGLFLSWECELDYQIYGCWMADKVKQASVFFQPVINVHRKNKDEAMRLFTRRL